MDVDQVLLKSLDPLRKFDCTGAIESRNTIGIGLILGKKNATFLNIWYQMYSSFKDSQWGQHSVRLPYRLSQSNPNLIHVENGTFYTPTFQNLPLLFEQNFDWSNSYAIHLYFRFYKKDHDPEDIKTLNNTIGSVFRHVFYGHREQIKINDTALLKTLPKII